MSEIKPNEVYTPKETEKLLKVSTSTMKRLLKRGLIKANKIGGQYRIMGKELLRMLSPELEQKAGKKYMAVKRKIVEKINPW
jgi:excisionase family DNA binding protein